MSKTTIPTGGLSDSAVTSAKITDATIATADIADSAVTLAKTSGVGGDLSFGGDTFGADKTIGSNDAYALSFETNNTVGLKIDNAGHITKPLQPAFLVKTGSTQSNYATATTHTVQFANEVFDNNADYNTGTYTFTAPVTGRYQLSCGLKINEIDKDSDYYQGQIVVSNNSIDIFNVRTAQVFNEDSTYYRWTVSMLVDMDANDTAYVTFRPQAGDATADINVNESLFSGFLAC